MKRIFPISFLLIASAYVAAPYATQPPHSGAAYRRPASTNGIASSNRTQPAPSDKNKNSPQDRKKDSPYKKHVRRVSTRGPKIDVALVYTSKFHLGDEEHSTTPRLIHDVLFPSDYTSLVICDRAPPGV
jgi:hypothetical protein